MVEVIRHSLGMCGEPHFNLFQLLLTGFGIKETLNYIKYKYIIKTSH